MSTFDQQMNFLKTFIYILSLDSSSCLFTILPKPVYLVELHEKVFWTMCYMPPGLILLTCPTPFPHRPLALAGRSKAQEELSCEVRVHLACGKLTRVDSFLGLVFKIIIIFIF